MDHRYLTACTTYLTGCTTHLGMSGVVKPGRALFFLERSMFFLASCLSAYNFQKALMRGFTHRTVLHFDKDARARGTEVPTVILPPLSPALFDLGCIAPFFCASLLRASGEPPVGCCGPTELHFTSPRNANKITI